MSVYTARPAIARGRLVLWLALLAVSPAALGADPAKKAPASKDPKDVADALAKIGSSAYAERESAVIYLLQQSPDALSQVEQYLEKAKDPEVITRLTRVAVHLSMKAVTPLEGKASMLGIALSMEAVDIGEVRTVITVVELQPGFPAVEYLRPGDKLLAVNGKALPPDFTIGEFQQFINGTKPGTKVRFTVLRGKEQLKLDVPLAGLKEAGPAYIQEFMAERAMRIEAYLSQLKTGASAPLAIPNRGPRLPLLPAQDDREF